MVAGKRFVAAKALNSLPQVIMLVRRANVSEQGPSVHDLDRCVSHVTMPWLARSVLVGLVPNFSAWRPEHRSSRQSVLVKALLPCGCFVPEEHRLRIREKARTCPGGCRPSVERSPSVRQKAVHACLQCSMMDFNALRCSLDRSGCSFCRRCRAWLSVIWI